MRVVCALDGHRRQIAYAIVDVGSGEMSRGRVAPATSEGVRGWLSRFDGLEAVHFALEGTTGWRFVVEESSSVRGIAPISPIRRRRRPSAAVSGGRRLTAPTAICC